MFGQRGIINCQPQLQDKEGELTLNAVSTTTVETFSNSVSRIRFAPSTVTRLTAYMHDSEWEKNAFSNTVSAYLSQLNSLQTLILHLSNSKIDNSNLQVILNSLTGLKSIAKVTIYLHQCPELKQGYLETIFKYLQATRTQTYVAIYNGQNYSQGRDFKTLADFLINNPTLEELNLQSFENSYDEEAHSFLCKGLAKNTHLQRITLQTITEPHKFWNHLLAGLSNNSTLERVFVRLLGGGNEKKLAIGLNEIYQTISSATIIVNIGHSILPTFQLLQSIKRETSIQLTAFNKFLSPLILINPQLIAADLYYD